MYDNKKFTIMDPIIVDFRVVKQKLIKTDEILKMYTESGSKLKKALQACNELKQKLDRTQLENDRCTFSLESLKSKYNTLDVQYKSLNEQKVSLEQKYNQQAVVTQQNIKDLEMEVQYLKELKKFADPPQQKQRPTVDTKKLEELEEKLVKHKNSEAQLKTENKRLQKENMTLQEELSMYKEQQSRIANEFKQEQAKVIQDLRLRSFEMEENIKYYSRLCHDKDAEIVKLKFNSKNRQDKKMAMKVLIDARVNVDPAKTHNIAIQTDQIPDKNTEMEVEDIFKEMTYFPELLSPIRSPSPLTYLFDSFNEQEQTDISCSPIDIPNLLSQEEETNKIPIENRKFRLSKKQNILKRKQNLLKRRRSLKCRDNVLRALHILKRSKINFTISNESTIPVRCQDYNLECQNTATFDRTNVECFYCKSRCWKRMYGVNERLLGLINVKKETLSPTPSRMEFKNETGPQSPLACLHNQLQSELTPNNILDKLAELVTEKIQKSLPVTTEYQSEADLGHLFENSSDTTIEVPRNTDINICEQAMKLDDSQRDGAPIDNQIESDSVLHVIDSLEGNEQDIVDGSSKIVPDIASKSILVDRVDDSSQLSMNGGEKTAPDSSINAVDDSVQSRVNTVLTVKDLPLQEGDKSRENICTAVSVDRDDESNKLDENDGVVEENDVIDEVDVSNNPVDKSIFAQAKLTCIEIEKEDESVVELSPSSVSSRFESFVEKINIKVSALKNEFNESTIEVGANDEKQRAPSPSQILKYFESPPACLSPLRSYDVTHDKSGNEEIINNVKERTLSNNCDDSSAYCISTLLKDENELSSELDSFIDTFQNKSFSELNESNVEKRAVRNPSIFETDTSNTFSKINQSDVTLSPSKTNSVSLINDRFLGPSTRSKLEDDAPTEISGTILSPNRSSESDCTLSPAPNIIIPSQVENDQYLDGESEVFANETVEDKDTDDQRKSVENSSISSASSLLGVCQNLEGLNNFGPTKSVSDKLEFSKESRKTDCSLSIIVTTLIRSEDKSSGNENMESSNCPASPSPGRPTSPTLSPTFALNFPATPSLIRPESSFPSCPASPILSCPESPAPSCPAPPIVNCPESSLPSCPASPILSCPDSPAPSCPTSPIVNCPASPSSNYPESPISNCLFPQENPPKIIPLERIEDVDRPENMSIDEDVVSGSSSVISSGNGNLSTDYVKTACEEKSRRREGSSQRMVTRRLAAELNKNNDIKSKEAAIKSCCRICLTEHSNKKTTCRSVSEDSYDSKRRSKIRKLSGSDCEEENKSVPDSPDPVKTMETVKRGRGRPRKYPKVENKICDDDAKNKANENVQFNKVLGQIDGQDEDDAGGAQVRPVKRILNRGKNVKRTKLQSQIMRQMKEKRKMFRQAPVCSTPKSTIVCDKKKEEKLPNNKKINIVQNILIRPDCSKPIDLLNSNVIESKPPATRRKKKPPAKAKKESSFDILSKIMSEMDRKVKPKTAAIKNVPVGIDEKQWRTKILDMAEVIHNADVDMKHIYGPKPCKKRRVGILRNNSALPKKINLLLKKLLDIPNEDDIPKDVLLEFKRLNVDNIIDIAIYQVSRDIYDKPDVKYYPAPLMTRTQRIFLCLLVRLEREKPFENILETFFSRFQEHMFRMGCGIRQAVPLTRLFLSLCRLHADIHRMRTFCCEAFFYAGDVAIPIFFTVLTSWSEVFPFEADVKNYPLAKVLVQLVHLKTCSKAGYNLLPLRGLLSQYYGYPKERWNCDELFEEIFQGFLTQPSIPTDYAVRLFCKHKDTKWVYKKINEYFKPLVYKIPDENVNFKATTVILMGKICRMFKPKDSHDSKCLIELLRWFEGLLEDNPAPILQQSIQYTIEHLPREGKQRQKYFDINKPPSSDIVVNKTKES